MPARTQKISLGLGALLLVVVVVVVSWMFKRESPDRVENQTFETAGLKSKSGDTSSPSPNLRLPARTADQNVASAEPASSSKRVNDLAVPLQEQMTAQDWVSYLDRMKLFGEQNAMRWLLAKHTRQ